MGGRWMCVNIWMAWPGANYSRILFVYEFSLLRQWDPPGKVKSFFKKKECILICTVVRE